MEFKGNQSSANSQTQPAVPRFSGGTPLGGGLQTDGSKKAWLTVIVIVVAIIIVGGLAMLGWKMMAAKTAVKNNQYQALFLTNGQVYFGKLANVTDKYVKMTDIYYLQVQQPVQPAEGQQQQDPQVSLVKLGEELHGPEDEMQINRDQVLFWENLKGNGKVAEAIKSHKEKQ